MPNLRPPRDADAFYDEAARPQSPAGRDALVEVACAGPLPRRGATSPEPARDWFTAALGVDGLDANGLRDLAAAVGALDPPEPDLVTAVMAHREALPSTAGALLRGAGSIRWHPNGTDHRARRLIVALREHPHVLAAFADTDGVTGRGGPSWRELAGELASLDPAALRAVHHLLLGRWDGTSTELVAAVRSLTAAPALTAAT